MKPPVAALLCALLLCAYSWDVPRAVDPNTVFFGEPEREKKPLTNAPAPSDKSYPWYCLEKGNAHFLAREYERAAIYFKAAFEVPGPTRVLSGFRLVETYDKLGRPDPALEVLAEMERRYLVSPREFAEAKHIQMALLDQKRKGLVEKIKPPFTGREWVRQLQPWRLRYVLDAMDELRRHGIPLKESAQGYTFLLDEYFLARPDAPAGDAAEAFAEFLYDHDADARLAIDRWRMNPEGTVTEEAKAFDRRPNKLTGAEWITMVQQDKLDYVSGAIEVLKNQRVPMEKGAYAYADALDKLFTENPELPASDSVVALGSLLRNTEPEAREVLEALRLE